MDKADRTSSVFRLHPFSTIALGLWTVGVILCFIYYWFFHGLV